MGSPLIESFLGVEADDRLAEAWFAVAADAAPVDEPQSPPPVRESEAAALRGRPRPGETRLCWLAFDGTEPAGTASLSLLEPPNLDLGWTHVTVRPSWRRRGVGTALLEAAVDAVRSVSRGAVLSEVAEGSPGERWATGHGFREVLREPQSVLDLTRVGASLLADVAGRDHAGYRLARWTGRVPEEFAASYATAKESMADAPTGDSGWQQTPWDERTLRDSEARIAEQGIETYGTLTVAPDGSVAGLTETHVDPRSPRRAGQEDTIVVRAHRGHGLGLWMKADLIEALRAHRPEVTEISTWNAATNDHMLAINRTLGFTVQTWWLNIRRELTSPASVGAP